MKRYFSINISIETPEDVNLDTVTDAVMHTIDTNDWTCGGGFVEVDEKGNPLKKEISQPKLSQLKPENLRTLMYQEDHQGYYFNIIVFETDSQLSIEEMGKISYEPIGAGRHSTHFDTFKELMEKHGHFINELDRLDKDYIPSNNVLEIVIGATGNY